MSKQTAVEWLVDELRNQIEKGTLDAIAISKLKMQAKAMEKEQMYDAIRYTIEEQYWRKTWANCEATLPVAEEYYFLTFEAKS
jgi:hypothetical protein